MTSVCVVVPNYNYGRFLQTCLASALSQQGVDVRVLLIDNSSSDDSVAVADAIAAADPRLTVRRRSVNEGLIASLNEGLRWALNTGSDLTMTLSSDDAVAPGALARAAAVFNQRPEVGLVHGRVSLLFDDDAPPPPIRPLRTRTTVEDGQRFVERICARGSNPLFDPEVVLRTSLYHEVGFYNPGLPHTSDLEMWLRAGVRTRVARIHGGDQAYYRIHANQHSRDYMDDALPDLRACQAAYESFLDTAVGGSEQSRLKEVAYRGLARHALRICIRAYERGTSERLRIDDIVAFARSLEPLADHLPEMRALTRRRRMSPSQARAMRLLDVEAAAEALRFRASRSRRGRTRGMTGTH